MESIRPYLLETTGIGQGDSKIVDISDVSIYVMTSDYGASMQLEKIDMLDLADIVVLNKFDKLGAQDAFDDIVHNYAHSHHIRLNETSREKLPVFHTIASDFNNPGVTHLFTALMQLLKEKGLFTTPGNKALDLAKTKELNHPHLSMIIPPEMDLLPGRDRKNRKTIPPGISRDGRGSLCCI